MEQLYDKQFYVNNVKWAKRSAEIVVPLIVDLFNPKSVVDFGCGTGVWLNEFSSCGIGDIRGYDGEYVLENELMINRDNFYPCDLQEDFLVDRSFDLAISLEVAEHLSSDYAEIFVDRMTAASNLVIFSAAVPGQGGIGHINEQWTNYWAQKFIKRGYVPIDVIRKNLVGSAQVRPYYRSNILAYTNRKDLLEKYVKYVTYDPEEYMLSESIEWMRRIYSKNFGNLKKKMQIIRELVDLKYISGMDGWLRKMNINTIAIWGMGEVGYIMSRLLTGYEVIMFDDYNDSYPKYEDYNGKDEIDLLIIALVEDVAIVKDKISSSLCSQVYSIEEFINEIS